MTRAPKPANTAAAKPAKPAKPHGPASLATVARKAQVSIATVSRIVNGQVDRASRETVTRVRALVDELGYHPNSVGRALKRRANHIVAMLSPNLDNPAMAAIAAATEAALREAGYAMILADTHDRPDLQDFYLKAMRAQLVKGYVLVSAVKSPGLAAMMASGEPVLFVNRRNPIDRSGAFVGIDNHAAGAEAARFFVARGIDKPAVLHSALTSSAIADRVAGFLEGLAQAGVPASAIARATAPGLAHLDIGYAAARDLVARHGWPKGLLCVSDMMAYGAHRYAVECRVGVPEQCVIVGIDDNAINPWLAPWLTSIHIPYENFGTTVVDHLQAIWAGETPGDRLLPHRLVVRT
jgi:LacI family transcriptional regulator